MGNVLPSGTGCACSLGWPWPHSPLQGAPPPAAVHRSVQGLVLGAGQQLCRRHLLRRPAEHNVERGTLLPDWPPAPPCSGPGEALDSWSGSIGRLLVLVEKTCQQIQKESMVHRVPIGAA